METSCRVHCLLISAVATGSQQAKTVAHLPYWTSNGAAPHSLLVFCSARVDVVSKED